MRYVSDRFKKTLVLVTLFIVILLSLFSIQKPDRDLRWYEKAMLLITANIQNAITGSINGIISISNNYVFLINVKKENDALIKNSQAMTEKINSLKEIEIENDRLRKLLEFKHKVSPFMVPAEVIAVDTSEEFKTIRIDKGEADNIKPDFAVVTPEGIVGRIYRVFGGYSDVLTIVDSNSAVHAIVQRSRAKGVIDGKINNTCRLKYVQRVDDIKLEDVIITSGLAGLFPKGLTIGTVSKIDKKEYGISQDIEVTPSVDFSKLEEVFVITKVIDIPANEAQTSSLEKKTEASSTKTIKENTTNAKKQH